MKRKTMAAALGAAMTIPLGFFSCAQVMALAMERSVSALDRSITAQPRLKEAESWTEGEGGFGINARKLVAKDGTGYLELSAARLAGYRLLGKWDGEAGTVQLDAAYYFENCSGGWTEFKQAIAGSVEIERSDGGIRIGSATGIERVSIEAARIRLGDKLYVGEDAAKSVENRHQRLSALADYLNSQEKLQSDAPGAAWERVKSRKGPDGERIPAVPGVKTEWKALLVPETLPEKKRGAAWEAVAADRVAYQEAGFDREEEYPWSRAYTNTIFPEQLREMRQTGALLRDFEEAGQWLYACHNWEGFNKALAEGAGLEAISKGRKKGMER